MARARNIKPGFFRNADLVELPIEARLLFVGLWTLADREGRLEDRPKQIKMEIFPADSVDCDAMLNALASAGFLVRYEVDGKKYAQVVNFTKHQMPHHKEVASEIPAPPGFKQITKHTYEVSAEDRAQVFARDGNRCLKCQSANNLSLDHVIALSSGGDNSTDNLQTLCKSCNSSKGGSTKDYRKVNVGSTLDQRSGNDGASCPTESGFLNPHSLITDSLKTPSYEGVAHASPGDACKAMKEAGMAEVSPSSPKLIALLEAGMTIPELVEATGQAVKAGKPFAYALAAAEGRRRDAAVAPLPAAGGSLQRSQTQSFAEKDREAGIKRWEEMTNRIHPERPKSWPMPADVIDADPPRTLAIGAAS